MGVLALAALGGTGCGGPRSVAQPTVFYPPLPQSPRLQYLVRYQNSKDLGVEVGSFQKFVTGKEVNVDALVKPHQAALFDGKLYICDSRRGEVVVMDIAKKEMSVMGRDELFAFGKPLSIAFANDGTRYIADNVKKRVFVFDTDDKFVKSFGEDGQFGPTSLAVYGDKLYVADIDGHEVEILDRNTGRVLRTFTGSEQSATGTFLMPANICVDTNGNLYVSDLLASNVQVFDADLNFVRNIGRQGDQLGTFGRPRGIAVDREGHVYVSDAAFENIQVFGADGTLMLYFGGPGTKPGEMYLPSGVTISYDGLNLFKEHVDKRFHLEYLLITSNQYGPNGVSIYGFGTGKPGYFSSPPGESKGGPSSKTEDPSPDGGR